MTSEPFEFLPTHKIHLASSKKPVPKTDSARMIRLTILDNQRLDPCGPCGGVCCKRIPGAYFPSDFGETEAEIRAAVLTPDSEIPELIKMLRTLRPDDQLRIERNYHRARAIELAEEVIIWRRRAEGPTKPTQDLFAQLELQVKAAASIYATNIAAKLPPTPALQETFYPEPAAPAPAPAATDPRAEFAQIRATLRLSQAAMAYRLKTSQGQISKWERGSCAIPADILRRAREELTP